MVSEQLQQYSLKSRADEVLREITRIFDEVGIEFAQNDAKMLVCEAFGCSMSDVSSAVLLQKPLETLIREDLQLSEDPQSDSKRKNPLELLKSCVSQIKTRAAAIHSRTCHIQIFGFISRRRGFYPPAGN